MEEQKANPAKNYITYVKDGVTYYEPSFKPKAKHPIFWVPASLMTEPAFKIFLATLTPTQKAAYHLSCTIPPLCRSNPKVINTVTKKVQDDFDGLEKELDDELARLGLKARNDGATTTEDYCNPEKQMIMSYTPTGSRFLTLLIKMDQVMQLVDALWYGSGIPESERNNKIMEWRNRLYRFHRSLSTHHLHALGIAAKVAHADDAAEAAELAATVRDVPLPTIETRKRRVVQKADTPKKMIARNAKASPVRVIAGTDVEDAKAESNRKKMEALVSESAPAVAVA